MLVALLALNALVLCKYYDLFTPITRWYWPLFIHNFHISGFDPITYSVVSDWLAGYNVYRHPLLAFYMYVPYLINQALMQLTGINCAIFIVAAIQVFCAFYSMVFIYRIFREVIEVRRADATVLTLFFFSFAYVMVAAIVPDHFIISMLFLLIALYISGRRMKSPFRQPSPLLPSAFPVARCHLALSPYLGNGSCDLCQAGVAAGDGTEKS